jgi:hypothetical protein
MTGPSEQPFRSIATDFYVRYYKLLSAASKQLSSKKQQSKSNLNLTKNRMNESKTHSTHLQLFIYEANKPNQTNPYHHTITKTVSKQPQNRCFKPPL